MAGLIDTNTGLRFGDGLQWQTAIGGAGLDIVGGSIPATAMITEASIQMITEAGIEMVTEA